MPPALTLTSRSAAPVETVTAPCARLAVYGTGDEPPIVDTLHADDAISLIEDLCDAIDQRSPLPAPAVREVVENLVHAGFRDAVVSVLDHGHTLRVTDHGPGIDDPVRALLPGYSTAGTTERAVVRGVGGGLPVARSMMEKAGGRLIIEENLGAGAAITMSLPAPPAPTADPVCSDTARLIMALLLEIDSGRPDRLARELDRDRGECGRELALLQHRGLVSREPGGTYRLTEAGSALLATLF